LAGEQRDNAEMLHFVWACASNKVVNNKKGILEVDREVFGSAHENIIDTKYKTCKLEIHVFSQ
jgi:hypothetical protein